ncbi:hypothetical protein Tco_0481298 [Tanacetum coccineum]
MHIYVSHLKDAELKTLIATYDIPLDLRPRLPYSNFRMINLPVGDTTISIYSRIFDSSGVRIPFSSFLLAVLKYFKVHISQLVPLGLSKVITFEVLCRSLSIEPTVTLFRVFQTLSKQGDWFSFAKRGGSAPVCMEVTKSRLKQWKEIFFLIDRRAIPFHMPWRHPDSCITDKVPTSFNQDHVDRLKAHIVKLRDIPEGVLVRSGLSRVWRNPMCDPVLRRSDNTVMSIHDFLCMPSLEKATVREELHELGTSILGRVVDRTHSASQRVMSSPMLPQRDALPDLILIELQRLTRAKRKTSTGSSGLAAGDGVEQTDDGTLDDDGQRDGSESAMEDVENLNDVGQGEHINVILLRTFDPSLGLDVEVGAHAELSGGVRRTTRASSYASHGVGEDVSSLAREAMAAPGTQPLDTNVGADEIASDGNVDSYLDARISNTAGDDDWEEIHGVNLGLRKKELYKDPKVCRTVIDRFPTPAEIHRLHELSSVELSDQTTGRTAIDRFPTPAEIHRLHELSSVELSDRKLSVSRNGVHSRHKSLRNKVLTLSNTRNLTVHASEEVFGLKAELGALKSKCEATEHKLSSWDKKHKKYRSDRDTLTKEKENIEEELKSQLDHRERQAEEIQGIITSFFQSDFTPLVRRFLKSSEFNRAFAGVLNTAISVGVERGLRMGRTDEEFRGLSQRVVGFIPDAREKFDRVIAAFPDTTFPFLGKVSQHSRSLICV